ncbi:MAG: hypothetical protein SVK08_00390 [Halobacteriota archaeon]|nr:hypothetical protein [Halobacteriota archaeon]
MAQLILTDEEKKIPVIEMDDAMLGKVVKYNSLVMHDNVGIDAAGITASMAVICNIAVLSGQSGISNNFNLELNGEPSTWRLVARRIDGMDNEVSNQCPNCGSHHNDVFVIPEVFKKMTNCKDDICMDCLRQMGASMGLNIHWEMGLNQFATSGIRDKITRLKNRIEKLEIDEDMKATFMFMVTDELGG